MPNPHPSYAQPEIPPEGFSGKRALQARLFKKGMVVFIPRNIDSSLLLETSNIPEFNPKAGNLILLISDETERFMKEKGDRQTYRARERADCVLWQVICNGTERVITFWGANNYWVFVP